QLDDEINLSVLSEGELLFSREQDKININHLIVPRLNELQALINHDLPEVERYQVQHQVTHRAIAQFIDALYPNRVFSNNSEKMNFLCEQIQLKDKNALRIIEHITDCLAYILMNLVHIFSARRVMLNSSLLQLKDFLLEQLNRKLKSYLVDNISTVSVIAGKYEWNSPIVAASAIKQGIYDGSLLTSLVKQEENIINF
ncbi:Mlc, partial [Aggregatibacter actinomycetemcomitans serotype d str. SA508]